MAKPRVLVVDDEEGIRRLISRALQDNYAVTQAADGAEGFAKAHSEKPHLIILDIRLPDIDGLTVLAKLKADSATRAIPVVIASVRSETDILFEAQQAGAADQLIKPFTIEALCDSVQRNLPLEVLDEAFRAAHTVSAIKRAVATILVVDDEPGIQRLIQRYLEPDFKVALASDAAEALEKARQIKPNLIFLDLRLPDKSGFSVLGELKADKLTRAIPVVIISGRGETEILFEGRDTGAADYLIKPFTLDQLRSLIERHLPID